MKNILFRVMLFASLMLVGLSSRGADQAKITIKILDEDGHVLGGMPVSAKFYQANGAKGTSDTNGLFILEGEAKMGEVNYSSQKEGFYRSEGRYTFSPAWSPKGGRFEPWNPVVTCVVRRVVNPIPMFAKVVKTKIPTTNSLCGYDLMAGDWVAPYGHGSRSDVGFTITGFDLGMTNYQSHLALSLTNCLDGILRLPLDQTGSKYILVRKAPEDGYVSSWTNAVGYLPGKGFFETQGGTFADSKDRRWGYVFRIRSATNDQGKITEVWYGKITGPISFFNCTERVLHFTYYLNPTPNDRNLEFDPKRNLFMNLGEFETVSEP